MYADMPIFQTTNRKIEEHKFDVENVIEYIEQINNKDQPNVSIENDRNKGSIPKKCEHRILCRYS